MMDSIPLINYLHWTSIRLNHMESPWRTRKSIYEWNLHTIQTRVMNMVVEDLRMKESFGKRVRVDRLWTGFIGSGLEWLKRRITDPRERRSFDSPRIYRQNVKTFPLTIVLTILVFVPRRLTCQLIGKVWYFS